MNIGDSMKEMRVDKHLKLSPDLIKKAKKFLRLKLRVKQWKRRLVLL